MPLSGAKSSKLTSLGEKTESATSNAMRRSLHARTASNGPAIAAATKPSTATPSRRQDLRKSPYSRIPAPIAMLPHHPRIPPPDRKTTSGSISPRREVYHHLPPSDLKTAFTVFQATSPRPVSLPRRHLQFSTIHSGNAFSLAWCKTTQQYITPTKPSTRSSVLKAQRSRTWARLQDEITMAKRSPAMGSLSQRPGKPHRSRLISAKR